MKLTLKNIFSENELEEDSVCANFAHTAEEGKEYQTKFYSLEEIRDTLLPKLMSMEVRVN